MPSTPIDLQFMSRPGLIGAWRTADAIVDPGPASTLPTLLRRLDGWRPRAIALTHIHFDHAGAVGALVRRWPGVEVIVHAAGARHLADPARLWESAKRVFGDELELRFGTMLPVPAQNIRALDGGERAAGLRTAATPGHAKHHLAYLDEDSGRAYVGDVCGVRLGAGPVLPPTPPPDVDLALWRRSLELIAAWGPSELALTHFGAVANPGPHLEEVAAALAEHDRLRRGGEQRYVRDARRLLARTCTPQQVADYELTVPLDQNQRGLQMAHERRRARDATETG
ncbi:MBL fold metallo-hydrolase [Conexibacter sp. CPCC 206217]|uniref:MBL fold metallo-hydrolase n=1 Tax=Conexibacter sp. CPCC 206217 TaxID=3064574 RepID=UPI0027283C17|nr:MBL fold metallo-hydrolase [Conexibacter sp. CPCC 206217]MDO8212004.1 MBL fold metallo-hydrolase [Conexibacter sp. CPCC 206217]